MDAHKVARPRLKVIRLPCPPCQIVYIVQGARERRQVLRPLRSPKQLPFLIKNHDSLDAWKLRQRLGDVGSYPYSIQNAPVIVWLQNCSVAVPGSTVFPLLLSLI